ncbi:MAG: type II toxin-antitoxin system VapC family toxin [Flavisolibacter sp.]|nr:type II toxin-antitoxin system VapC family toxin [Flavisolibacter sp.]
MAAYLLDTHALIWFFEENPLLPRLADATIRNTENQIYFSIASFWEIAVKLNIGKLHLGTSIKELSVFCFQNNIEITPVSLQHIATYVHLPLLHRDPFDRMLIAQALVHGFTIITKDSYFEPYQVPVLWTTLL